MRRGSPEWRVHPENSRGAGIDKEMREIEAHPMIDAYKPSFVGEGATQIVFEVPNHPNIVAKVNGRLLRRLVKYNAEKGNPPDAFSPEVEASLKELINEEKKVYQEARAYFGDMLPAERVSIVKVPMSEKLLSATLGDETREFVAGKMSGVLEFPAQVRFQERLPSVTEEDGVDIRWKYLETDAGTSDEEYVRLNGIFSGKVSGAEYLKSFKRGEALVTFIESHPECKAVIRDFVEKALRYTREKHEILDCAGTKNVMVYQASGVWNMKLADALYGGEVWTHAHEALEKIKQGVETTHDERNRLMNSLNYARLMNALADVVGCSDRLSFTGSDIEAMSIDIRRPKSKKEE